MANDQPKGLKADKGIELLTWGTPNGWKASIMLEELKEAYGKDYTWQGINISTNVQKEPWFTKLGPNGRIPVIVDHDQGGFPVQEGLGMYASVPMRAMLTAYTSNPHLPHPPLRPRPQIQLHRPLRHLARRTVDGLATRWPGTHAGPSEPLQPLH
jgi:hypothetical protein